MEDEGKIESEGVGVKTLSKWTMVFATVWIIAGSILNWLGVFQAETTDIIMTGIGIMAIWSPTYVSIWLDKIRDIRFGGER